MVILWISWEIKPPRKAYAIQYLQKSLEADPNSGQSCISLEGKTDLSEKLRFCFCLLQLRVLNYLKYPLTNNVISIFSF